MARMVRIGGLFEHHIGKDAQKKPIGFNFEDCFGTGVDKKGGAVAGRGVMERMFSGIEHAVKNGDKIIGFYFG